MKRQTQTRANHPDAAEEIGDEERIGEGRLLLLPHFCNSEQQLDRCVETLAGHKVLRAVARFERATQANYCISV